MNMNSECPICKRAIDKPWTMVAGLRVHKSCERDALEQNRNDLLKELSDLRKAVMDMSKTASGTYNEKRVSVDKKKMQRARDLAMTPIANLDYSEPL